MKKIEACVQSMGERRGKTKTKSDDGTDNEYIPKWIHFNHLHFLADLVVPK